MDNILFDPQTSGGLLVAVNQDKCDDFILASENTGQQVYPIGYFKQQLSPGKNIINVI